MDDVISSKETWKGLAMVLISKFEMGDFILDLLILVFHSA